MKNEKTLLVFVMLIFMGASFFAGYKFSPGKTTLEEKDQKIKELENTIVQQQISSSYIIKHMANNPAMQNLNNNRNKNAH